MSIRPGKSGPHKTVEDPKKIVCPNGERVERRAFRSRFKPAIDVLVIAVLIGCLHLVLRLVTGMTTVIFEMKDQTKTIKHIDNNINDHLERGKK